MLSSLLTLLLICLRRDRNWNGLQLSQCKKKWGGCTFRILETIVWTILNQAAVSELDNNQAAVLCTHKALCWIKWFSARLQQLFQEAFAPIVISFIFLHRCSEGIEQNIQLRFLPFPLQSGRISFNQEVFPVPLGKTFLSGYFTLPPVTFCFCCLWVRC